MTIEERAQRYADAYKGILPDELIESTKLWIMEEFRLVAEDARNEERKRTTDWALKNYSTRYINLPQGTPHLIKGIDPDELIEAINKI